MLTHDSSWFLELDAEKTVDVPLNPNEKSMDMEPNIV
jgi:hypothetical protein